MCVHSACIGINSHSHTHTHIRTHIYTHTHRWTNILEDDKPRRPAVREWCWYLIENLNVYEICELGE
jgi:hypothetical protein